LLDLAEDGGMPDVFRPLLRTLKAAADGMVVIISDMLDLSRMERGEFSVRPTVAMADSIAAEAADRMAPFAAEFGVSIKVDVAAVAGVAMWADPGRVTQILTNLLSNAVKFSPHDGTGSVLLRATQHPCGGAHTCAFAGEPLLTATHAAGDAEPAVSAAQPRRLSVGVRVNAGRPAGTGIAPPRGSPPAVASRASSGRCSGVMSTAPGVCRYAHIVYEVVDNGCGIPAAEVGLLFKPFVQLAAGEAYKGRGTGLGLAITRNIAARHQGVMAVRSQEGTGSVFSLDLHVGIVDRETTGSAGSPAASNEPASPASDDSMGPQDARRRWRVGRIGAETTGSATSAPSTGAPAPAGGAVAVTVGASTHTASDTFAPVVAAAFPALPADSSAGDVTDCAAPHSPSAYAAGPSRESDVINVSVTGAGPTSDSGMSPAVASQPRRNRRWLMVDDVETNVKLLTRLLQRRCPGDEFVMVYSGAAALSVLTGQGVGAFDVVVSDKEMPGMDGHELARQARAAGFRGVLLGCTGNAMPRDREMFVAAGADDVVFKPVDVGSLLATVLELERRGEGDDVADGGGSPIAVAATAPARAPPCDVVGPHPAIDAAAPLQGDGVVPDPHAPDAVEG